MPQKPLIDRIKKHYAAIGGERGALSEFARDLKLDPRVVHTWERIRRVIPAAYGDEIESVTGGAFKAAEVVAEDVAYLKARKDLRIKRKETRAIAGRRHMRAQGAPA